MVRDVDSSCLDPSEDAGMSGWFKETPTSQWQAKVRNAWEAVQRSTVNREDIWKCCA